MMSPLYNPKDKDESQSGTRWKPRAGVYRFEIAKCSEKTFKSGNSGFDVEFRVFAGGKYPCKAWENFVIPQALWKVEQLCFALGIPFDPAPEADDLVDLGGEAEWETEQNGEYTNLKVKEFLAKADEAGPPDAIAADGIPEWGDDKVPF